MVAALAVAAALVTVAPAGAADCGKQVIADWYDNGRVDRLYDLACYTKAIKQLPTDVLDYSTAREDILRALSFAKQGKGDPGDTTPDETGETPTTSGPGTTTSTTTTGKTTTTTTATTDETDTTETDGGPIFTGAEPPAGSSGPSSVPVPLIVLGGLALLLLAAGSAGYLTRRLQARRAGDEPPIA